MLAKNKKIIQIMIFFLLLIIILANIVYAGDTGDQLIEMNFKGADIRDVLRTIAELADVNLITDGSVQGPITIHLKDISFADALALITQANGLAYYWDGQTVVVATPERIEAIYFKEITETVGINYVELTDIKNIINGLYSDLKIQLDENNKQLIIMGKAEEVKESLSLIEKLDISKEIVTKIVKINYIDLTSVENNIKIFYPDLKLQSDLLNDQLIICGKKGDVNKAIALIRKLDLPKEEITEIARLKYGGFAEIKDNINQISPDLKIQLDEGNEQLIITGSKKEVQAAIVQAQRLDLAEKRLTEIIKIDYADLTELEGIVAELHPDLNLQLNELKKELIINGREEKVREAISLVKRLDTPRRQVIIEARIEEVRRTELTNIGVSPDQLTQINFTTDDEGQINGLKLSWPEMLKVLEENGTAQTLANPRLLTINGEEAKLLIGDRIPVEVEEIEDGQARKTIEFIDAGITLEFKPWITSDNQIILEISPKVSSIGESVGGSLPAINTREAETKIRLKDGQTFAIGGLIRDDIIESISKVPLLSSIPILGEIFKHNKADNIKTEVIIFITPHIVKESDLTTIKQEEKDLADKGGNPFEENEIDKAAKTNKVNNVDKIDDGKKEQTIASNSKELLGLTKDEIEGILIKARQQRGDKGIAVLPAFLNISYLVKPGETLNHIAGKYRLKAEDISFVNGLQGEVEPGMIITIPIPKNHLYRIKKEDTLWRLHMKFGVELEHLKEINNLTDKVDIPVGKIIIISKELSE